MADWNERYSRGEHATLEPSRLLVRAAEIFAARAGGESPGSRRALDIECGAGRHAIFLAERGFVVTAVDSSCVGVQMTRERGRERGFRLDARVADLKGGEFRIAPDSYDLVCDFYYLQRDLFPSIRDGVRHGGMFVASIHMTDDDPEVRPMNPDFLLRPAELREEFRGWEILRYEETAGHDSNAGEHTRRSAELIARK